MKSWLASLVEDWESLSSRDDMGCTEHSSTCSTEIDDPLYLRRLSQGVSRGSYGSLQRFLKGVKPLVLYVADRRVVMEPMQGKWTHLNLILGTPSNFAFLGGHQCSSGLVTVLFGTLWSSIKQIEAPYVFDWENEIALDTMQGNQASSHREGKVSWVFSSCGRHVGYILELRWGCPF